MVYSSQDETLVCKVMPAKESTHWKDGWNQNEVEAQVYKTVAEGLCTKSGEEHPELQVAYHGVIDFLNTWDQPDKANCLVIPRLGPDLKWMLKNCPRANYNMAVNA